MNSLIALLPFSRETTCPLVQDDRLAITAK